MNETDPYCGEPLEIAALPVFRGVGFGVDVSTKEPSPSRENQRIAPEGSIWEFCADFVTGSTWAEFGVENGTSARYFLERLPADGTFYLFDSFEGLPEEWYGHEVGHRRATFVPRFSDSRAKIVKGWFKDTLPIDVTFDFVHIDCDLYSSTKTVLDNINVRIGTIILFDELWGYPDWEDHEYKALNEWDRSWKYIARDKNYRAAIEIL